MAGGHNHSGVAVGIGDAKRVRLARRRRGAWRAIDGLREGRSERQKNQGHTNMENSLWFHGIKDGNGDSFHPRHPIAVGSNEV